MIEIYYDLNKLRTGTLVKCKDDTNYYLVLGFESRIINLSANLVLIKCETKKPTLEEIYKHLLDKDLIAYPYVSDVTDDKGITICDYNYLSEKESKLLLLKYNFVEQNKLLYNLGRVKWVKRNQVRNGHYYQDVLCYYKNKFFVCNNNKLLRVPFLIRDLVMHDGVSERLIEVDETYIEEAKNVIKP